MWRRSSSTCGHDGINYTYKLSSSIALWTEPFTTGKVAETSCSSSCLASLSSFARAVGTRGNPCAHKLSRPRPFWRGRLFLLSRQAYGQGDCSAYPRASSAPDRFGGAGETKQLHEGKSARQFHNCEHANKRKYNKQRTSGLSSLPRFVWRGVVLGHDNCTNK